VHAIAAAVAARERVEIPGEHLIGIVAEARGNVRRALTLLEMYAMKRRAGATAALTVPEWERYTDALCGLVKNSKLDGTVMKAIRNHLYELIVHCVPPTEIFRRLVHVLLMDLDVSLVEPVTAAAAAYEARMQNGTKAIFHLEAFLAQFVCIYRDFFAEAAADF
jgi:replication factor C subunit 3/5